MATKMKCGGGMAKGSSIAKRKPKKAFLGSLLGGILGGSKSKNGGSVPANKCGGKTKKKK